MSFRVRRLLRRRPSTLSSSSSKIARFAHESISKDESWIGNVQVGALTDRLLHPVGEIAECTCHPLAGNRNDGTETLFVDNDVNALRFQSAKNRCLGTGCACFVELDRVSATSLDDTERRPRFELIGMESSLQNEATRYVPVERLDVLLALGSSIVACEVVESIVPVYPPTSALSAQFQPASG